MKIKNKTILMFILMFTGITLSYSQGWGSSSSATNNSDRSSTFTCPNQGLAADKTVVVQVKYNRKTGKPSNVKAFEINANGNHEELKSDKDRNPYYFGKEKTPAESTKPKLYAFPAKDTGPPPGATICTENNYPVFVYGDKAWFFYK